MPTHRQLYQGMAVILCGTGHSDLLRLAHPIVGPVISVLVLVVLLSTIQVRSLVRCL